MAESFFSLSRQEQSDALGVAAAASGRPVHLLEKDIWVVWTLNALFESHFGDHLVFKGGTSLSKAYKAIRRFSEDIDITYDIRQLAPGLVKDAPKGQIDALPDSKAQQKRWSDSIRKELLPTWIKNEALPLVKAALEEAKVSAEASFEDELILIEYKPLAQGSGYIAPIVRLEFGARSSGEPADVKEIVCDAAEYLENLVFPTASPRVMRAERTFWEKATAIHVYCLQNRLKGDRFARHWYDITRLAEAGYATSAAQDKELAQAVANHKGWFFSEKGADGAQVDYVSAVSGHLRLVPEGEAREKLQEDYEAMVGDRVLLDDGESFDDIMAKCGTLQEQVNGLTAQSKISS